MGSDLQLDQIQPGTYWPEAEGNISGELQTSGRLTSAGGWEVELPKLDIDGIFRDYPLNVNGALDAKDVQGNGQFWLDTPGLVVAHGQNRIRLSGNLDKTWNLDAKLDIPELEHSVPEVEGAVIGDVELRGEQNTPEVILDLAVNKLAWQDQLTIETVTLKGDVVPLPAPKGQMTLGVSQLDYQGRRLIAVSLISTVLKKRIDLISISILRWLRAHLALKVERSKSLIWSGKAA
ncbi:protein ytfN [Vibrio ishigakensis]|uniref:Protein ytfN n=1 Tax=Vibrio ishigakensis TaxID=1481914 RepID=A0A0B8P6I9_9VIBR|nr:protein ytfN [Vibrio ishigakensis]